MKAIEIVVVAIALLLAKCTVEAGTEPINTNTADGHVKVSGTNTGTFGKPIDFTDVFVIGLSGSGVGTVTSITATSPIVVTPSPITATGVISFSGPLSLSLGGTAANLTDPAANTLWGWDDTDNAIKFITIGSGLNYDHSTHTISTTAQAQNHAITFVCDGAGSVLTTGTKNPVKIPYGGTLTGWLLIGSPSGSATVDIFRAADGAGLPVTSIVGAGTKPALSTAVENSSTSFTSWTSTTLTAKDNLAISLSGVTSSTYVALTLYFQ